MAPYILQTGDLFLGSSRIARSSIGGGAGYMVGVRTVSCGDGAGSGGGAAGVGVTDWMRNSSAHSLTILPVMRASP